MQLQCVRLSDSEHCLKWTQDVGKLSDKSQKGQLLLAWATFMCYFIPRVTKTPLMYMHRHKVGSEAELITGCVKNFRSREQHKINQQIVYAVQVMKQHYQKVFRAGVSSLAESAVVGPAEQQYHNEKAEAVQMPCGFGQRQQHQRGQPQSGKEQQEQQQRGQEKQQQQAPEKHGQDETQTDHPGEASVLVRRAAAWYLAAQRYGASTSMRDSSPDSLTCLRATCAQRSDPLAVAAVSTSLRRGSDAGGCSLEVARGSARCWGLPWLAASQYVLLVLGGQP